MLLTGKDETMTMFYYLGGPESRNATCVNSGCAMIEKWHNRQYNIATEFRYART